MTEVNGNFSEIRVIWIRKSYEFDLGKVVRYNILIFETCSFMKYVQRLILSVHAVL